MQCKRFAPNSDRESGHQQRSCLLYPRKRTCAARSLMSAMGQKRTLRQYFVWERGARASRLDVVANGVEASLVGEEALSRDVVHLQPDAVGILEQHRVVARGPRPVFRRMYDLGTHLAQVRVQTIDVLASVGAEAEVVEPDPGLHEGCLVVRRLRGHDRHRG